jgi:integrase
LAKALTARRVETEQSGDARREIPDGLLPGLYLVVHVGGAKGWAVRYRHHGRTRKLTLGRWPAIDLATARKLGTKALRSAAEGRDPATEKAKAKADTVAAVAADFVRLHCLRKNRPSTAEGTKLALDVFVLSRFGNRLLKDITRRDVLALLDGIVDRGTPVMANRVLAAFRKMCNWAVDRDIVEVSPCAGVKRPSPETSRDRVLSDDELGRIWHAADRLGGPFGNLVKLLALTGQRRDEVAAMEWAELDLPAALWVLPAKRVKNNQPHQVALSSPALAVLEGIPRIGDRFVLTTNGTAPSSGYSKGKRALDALLPGMPRWTLHDLRRTMASTGAKLGIALPVIERILNHISGSFGGVAGVYQRHAFLDEQRAALERWGTFVSDLVALEPPKPRKVVKLSPRAREHAQG